MFSSNQFNSSNSAKQVFLKISQNLQENTCARFYYEIKLQATCNIFLKNKAPAQVLSF